MNDATSWGMPLQLLTGLGFFGLAAIAAYAWRAKHPALIRPAVGVGAGWIVVYGVLLAIVSLHSHEVELAPGHWKYFCGFYLDCHAMVTVAGVDTRAAIGDVQAQGAFYVVTLRRSSSARRARIGLAHPVAVVVDEAGRRYPSSPAGQQALERSEGAQPDLGRRIEPEETYDSKVVFDLPAGIRNPRLLVYEDDVTAKLTEMFLIGDEDSLWHKKTVFDLQPAPTL